MGRDSSQNLTPIIAFAFSSNLGELIIAEVLPLDGYEVQLVRTSAQAFTLLESQAGDFVVCVDNVQVYGEAQSFLRGLREHPDLRDRLKVVCMIAEVNRGGVQHTYGEVIDAYLYIPFTPPELFEAVESVCGQLAHKGAPGNASPAYRQANTARTDEGLMPHRDDVRAKRTLDG